MQHLNAEINLDQLNSLVEDRDILAENLENLFQKERLQSELIGIQKGRMEGETRLLRKMIKMKFGDLPQWADELISTADSQQIDAWAELLLSANSIEALLGKH